MDLQNAVMVKKVVALGVLALSITSCTPTAMEGLGRGLSQMAAPAAPTTAVVSCYGTSSKLLYKKSASLNLSVFPDGRATGSFTNNGTLFSASGTGTLATLSTITVQLDSSTGGGFNADASAYTPLKSIGYGVSGSVGYGSQGTLSGTISPRGSFQGKYRGPLGNFDVSMTCTGARS